MNLAPFFCGEKRHRHRRFKARGERTHPASPYAYAPPLRFMSRRFRRFHGQPDPLFLRIHAQHPDLHHVPHLKPVSYTHLDVYKRQLPASGPRSALNKRSRLDRHPH